MSDVEAQIYGLIEVAARQQAAVQSLLEGLAAERAASKHTRQELALQTENLSVLLRSAVYTAVREAFGTVATGVVEAVQVAAKPFVSGLEGLPEIARQAEAALQRVVRWASWRLLGWLVAFVAAMILLGSLTSAALLWWDSSQIRAAQQRNTALVAEMTEIQADLQRKTEEMQAELQRKKDEMQAELQRRTEEMQAKVAVMQANYDDWVKRGMLAKLIRCNPGARPCIRVDESAGPFEAGGYNDYRVIQGY
jgi:hypothetical protein